MTKRKVALVSIASGLLISLGFLVGCGGGGNTDGGESSDSTAALAGQNFVPTDSNAGSIELNVDSTSLNIGSISNFSVTVTDVNNTPVPHIKVSCDTEAGLAIIEPNSGSELTGTHGTMSGIVGCESPGSYQMACRLPIGANKRQFVGIHCTGSVPEGFEGFPGAAGGTLGGSSGGVASGDSGVGGSDLSGIRITRIQAVDDGTFTTDTSTLSIDTDYISDCDEDPETVVAEPFFDTVFRIAVKNDSTRAITFTSFNYTISDSDGNGTPFTSSSLSLSETRELKPCTESAEECDNSDDPFLALMFIAKPGSGSDKFFNGSSTAIDSDVDFANVTIRLIGETSEGQEVVITGRTALSFGAFDRCAD